MVIMADFGGGGGYSILLPSMTVTHPLYKTHKKRDNARLLPSSLAVVIRPTVIHV